MTIPAGPIQNDLLAALPASEGKRLLAQMDLVPMELGKMLYEPDEQMRYAYFPTTSIISLYYVTESGACSEAAGVGKEGMLGVSLFMGGMSTSSSAVVRTAGYAYQLDRKLLKEEFSANFPLQRLLLRYTQALMTHMFQTAACNRHHSVEQQLSRWLLLTQDRMPAGEMVMTQELVAGMLGVRRESVTTAAGALQNNGCINYRRGHISVLDRKALEERTCECYGVVKTELKRLMSIESFA